MGEVAKIFEKGGPCYVDFLDIFWKFLNILFGYCEILTKRGEIKTQKVEGFWSYKCKNFPYGLN